MKKMNRPFRMAALFLALLLIAHTSVSPLYALGDADSSASTETEAEEASAVSSAASAAAQEETSAVSTESASDSGEDSASDSSADSISDNSSDSGANSTADSTSDSSAGSASAAAVSESDNTEDASDSDTESTSDSSADSASAGTTSDSDNMDDTSNSSTSDSTGSETDNDDAATDTTTDAGADTDTDSKSDSAADSASTNTTSDNNTTNSASDNTSESSTNSTSDSSANSTSADSASDSDNTNDTSNSSSSDSTGSETENNDTTTDTTTGSDKNDDEESTSSNTASADNTTSTTSGETADSEGSSAAGSISQTTNETANETANEESSVSSETNTDNGDTAESTDSAGDSSEDDESIDAESEEETFYSGTLVYENEKILVTATFDEDACIPEGAVLTAKELTGSDLEEAVDALEKELNLEEDQEILPVLFDIHFSDEGKEIEPAAGKVQVTIQYLDEEVRAAITEAEDAAETGTASSDTTKENNIDSSAANSTTANSAATSNEETTADSAAASDEETTANITAADSTAASNENETAASYTVETYTVHICDDGAVELLENEAEENTNTVADTAADTTGTASASSGSSAAEEGSSYEVSAAEAENLAAQADVAVSLSSFSVVGEAAVVSENSAESEEEDKYDTSASSIDSSTYTSYTTYYALLYSDGGLVFQPTNTKDTEKESEDSCTLSYTYTITSSTSSRPWSSTYSSITSVTFTDGYIYTAPSSLASWFNSCTSLTTITNPELLDTSSVTSLQQTFYNCSSLTTLDLSGWDTSSVTTLYQTFRSCTSLTTLGLSSWDTSSVTTLYQTFYGCSGLTELDVSNWDMSKVTNLQETFNGCSSLTTLGVSNWDLAKVTTIRGMFYNCSKLTTLDVSEWDTSKVNNLQETFSSCSSLTTLDLSKWDTSNVTTLYRTFYKCTGLTALNVSNWNTSSVTTMYCTFDSCSSLTTVDVSKWDTSSVTTMYSVFSGSSSLTTVDVSGWDTSNVTTMQYTFNSCSSLTTLNVSNWDTSKVTSLYRTFYDCKNLTALEVSNWDTSSVTTLYYTFYNCAAVAALDVSGWDTSKVTTLYCTFDSCSSLTTVDVSKWDTSSVTTMYSVFSGSSSLTTVDVSGWDTSNVTTMQYTFNSCSSLTTLNVSNWDTSKVTSLYRTFYDCKNLTALEVSNWKTSAVTTLSQTFYGCSSLTTLNVSDWDTSNVTTLYQTFCSCSSLTSLDMSSWDTSNVTNLQEMFNNCSKLTTLDVSGWNTSKVTTLFCTFGSCSSLTTVDVSEWDTSNVTTMRGTFYICSSLTTLDVSEWDTSSVTSMLQMFYNCSQLTALDVSEWDTSSVTDLKQIFYCCSSLAALDVSGWNTSNVTNYVDLFNSCTSLESLDISGWDMSAATTSSAKTNMLQNLTELKTLTIGAKTDLTGTGLGTPGYNWAQVSTAHTITETDDDGNTYTYTNYTMVTSSEIITLSSDGSITGAETFSREATVSFYANGGTPSSETTIYNGVVFGQDFTITEPTRTGYTFAGWYTSRTGGTKLEEGCSETVYYDESGNEVDVASYNSDTGKYYDSSGNEVTFASYETIVYTSDGTVSDAPVISQAIYYAQWIPVSYTLVLNANGGAGTDSSGSTITTLSVSLDYGSFYTLNASGFTYDGYVLSSWNTKRDGSGTTYAVSSSVGNLTTTDGATVTLYAQWTPTSSYATAVFDVVGNYDNALAEMETTDNVASSEDIEEITEQSLTIGETIGLLSEAYCEGLSFVEWRLYLDEDLDTHAAIIAAVEELGEDGYDSHDAETTYDDDDNKTKLVISDSYTYTVDVDGTEVSYTVVKEQTTTYTYEYDEDGEVVEDSQTESGPTTVYYITVDEDLVVSSVLLDEDNVLNLSAVWTGDISIIVVFNDGINGTASEKRVANGSAVGTLPTFEDGYNGDMSLLGWYTAAQDSTDAGSAEQITEDLVLYATSDLLVTDEDGETQYTVTYYAWWGWKPYFDTNGGKITSDISGITVKVSSSYAVTLPTAARDGYSFDYWTLSYETTDETTNETTVVTTILYKNVTYAASSTTSSGTCVIYNNITYGSIDALITAVGSSALEYAAAGDSVTIDLAAWGRTLTANWTAAETVTISLDLTSGFISYVKESESEDGGSSSTEATVESTSEAYDGTVTDEDGNTEEISYSEDVSYDYSTTLTLYSTSTISGLYTPSLDGYSFVGWALVSTDESGTASYVTDSSGEIVYVTNGMTVSSLAELISSSSSDASYTLMAVFAKLQYTITYDPGDGTMYGLVEDTLTEDVAAGVYTGTVPGAALSNYEFVGWYTGCGDDCTGLDVDTSSSSFTRSRLISGTTEITGDVTYHAHYESAYITYTTGDISFKYAINWSNANTADVDNVDGNLEFHPTTGASQTATLYIYFDLLEGSVTEAGTVKIYIPKDIWDGYGTIDISTQLAAYYDADGNVLDAVGTFSYYEYTDPDTGEEYYVIINNKAISAGFSVEISYTVNPMNLEGGAQDSEGNYIDGYTYYQTDVPVRIVVDTDQTDDTLDVDETITLSVEMHTDVNPTTTKSYSGIYTSWDEDWGDEPEDSEDYVYIVWKLKANYTYNSQSVTYYWDEDSVHDGTIVKWLTQNSDKDYVPVTQTVYDEDGNAVYDEDGNLVTEEYTGTTSPVYTLSSASGSTTVYVLIKYPAEYFTETYLEENGGYTVTNQAVLHSVWASGYEETQAVSATKTIPYVTTDETEEDEEEDEEGVLGMSNKFSKDNTNADGEAEYISGAQEVLVNDEEGVDLVWKAVYSGGVKRNTWTTDDDGNVTLPTRTITITDGNTEDTNLEDTESTGITTGDLIYSSGEETDRYIWDPERGNVSLYDEDYTLNSISFKVLEYEGYFNNGTLKKISLINTVSDYGKVKIYIRTRGSDSYTYYRSVSVDSAGSSAEYKTVKLPSNTVGYQIVYETEHYGTKIYVKGNFTINPTVHVQSLVGEDLTNDVTSIFKNIAHCTVTQTAETTTTDEDGNETTTEETTTVFDTDNYTSASKSCEEVIYELDKRESEQYTRKYSASSGQVVYDANASTQDSANYLAAWNYNPTEGRKTYMSSGVFYDLLPQGTSVDTTTVFGMVFTENMSTSDVYNRTGEYSTLYSAWQNGSEDYEFLNQGLYDIQFVSNWEGSGRTMMIITWSAPSDTKITGIQFWYQLHTTYTNIKLYGNSQENDVAFVNTSTNVAVPVTLSSEQDVIDDNYEDYFDVLYAKTSAGGYGYSTDFISYAISTVTYIPVSYNSWGFSKTVKGDSSEYTESDVTTPGGSYSYKMTYSLTGTTEIKDIVFIDVLENGTDDLETYWRGYFDGEETSSETDSTFLSNVENSANTSESDSESTDTGSTAVTCDPKVYYSTMDRDDFYTEGSTGESLVVDETYKSTDATYTDVDGNTQSVWVSKSEYESAHTDSDGNVDYSAVTAVMVDCTKDTNGNDFVLAVDSTSGEEDSKSLSWVINMTAPDAETYESIFESGSYDSLSDVYGLHATNEAFVFYTTETGDEESASSSGSEGLDGETSSGTSSSTASTSESASGYKEDPAQITLLDVSIAKESDPASGTESDPTEVYEGSTLNYTLTVTNKNDSAEISPVVVEDDNISSLLQVTGIQVRFYYTGSELDDEDDWISIDSSPRVSYTTESVSASTDSDDSDDADSSGDSGSTDGTTDSDDSSGTDSTDSSSQSGTKYIFTINTLAAQEVVQIRICTEAYDLSTDLSTTVVQNTASITSVGGTDYDIESETTWHKIIDYALPETGSFGLILLLLLAGLTYLAGMTLRRRRPIARARMHAMPNNNQQLPRK